MNNRFKETNQIVKTVLTEEPETRNSDDALYLAVIKRLDLDIITLPFYVFIKRRKEKGLPPYETVRRSRQKIQEEFPELRANDEVEIMRNLNEEYYRRFARG